MIKSICIILMFPIFHLFLKTLIISNYKKRALGLNPDKWYWADYLAVKFGYFVDGKL